MEIDIPDLDDVVFEFNCGKCYGQGTQRHFDPYNKAWGAPVPCERCAGKGKFVSPVGERLIAFLKERGVELKEKE